MQNGVAKRHSGFYGINSSALGKNQVVILTEMRRSSGAIKLKQSCVLSQVTSHRRG